MPSQNPRHQRRRLTTSRVSTRFDSGLRGAGVWARDLCATSVMLGLLALMCTVSTSAVAQAVAGASPASTQTCNRHEALKQPLFGDLHVHTGLSFDAYISSIRLGPDAAYRYAKGEPIQLPGADGLPGGYATIDRPLDFAAVTDHGEFLGQVAVCTAETGMARFWPLCAMSRANNLWVQLLADSW